MRVKTAGLVILTTFLVLALGLIWQINDIQRGSADEIQLGKEQTVLPSTIDNDNITLSLVNDAGKVAIGQTVNYTIFYTAKKDLRKVRIIGALGETNTKISPAFTWEFDDIGAGTSGTFTVPVTIKAGDAKLAISRVTLSQVQKPSWWGKERREIIATVDVINQISE